MTALAETAIKQEILAEIRRRGEAENARAERAERLGRPDAARLAARAARFWWRLLRIYGDGWPLDPRDRSAVEQLRRGAQAKLAAEAMHQATKARNAAATGALA